jgi:hypothetical protein
MRVYRHAWSVVSTACAGILCPALRSQDSFSSKEPPGKVYQGGDIDGRMKTLVDALTMPRHVEQVLDNTSSQLQPIYCLLEEDSLVSGLEIESERLLGDQDSLKDWVRLMIEVDVRVRQATIYNQSFLG